MWQRVLGIFGSLLMSFLAFGGWLWLLRSETAVGETAVSPQNLPLIINEWSQGNGGSREWVELLVTTPTDLRGWDVGDSTPGDLTFSNDSFWETVTSGTLIVIYNGNDRDTVLPEDDEDPSDCRLVLAHNNGRFFSGSWPAFSNSNNVDNPHLRNAADATIHDFTSLPGGNWHPGSQSSVAFIGSSSETLGEQWQSQTAASATPGTGNSATNSAWIAGLCAPATTVDLAVRKTGPTTAQAGDTIVYDITVQNQGAEPATAVSLTDTLPTELTYLADNSGLPINQPTPQTIVWEVGSLPANASPVTFQLTATVSLTASGRFTNTVTAATASSEDNLNNNSATATTAVHSLTDAPILIDAIFYNGYETSDIDEAIGLRNVSSETVDLSGWTIGDGGNTTAVLPANTALAAGDLLWLTHNGAAFERQFGVSPHFEATNSDPLIPNLDGGWPGFTNTGDEVILTNGSDEIVDLVVYGTGDTSLTDWEGTAVQPYTVPRVFTDEGQILYRKRDQHSGLVVPDTNSAQDWAQERGDVINGRKIRHPGWDFDAYFHTVQVTETAVLTVAIAPDNSYQALAQQIQSAQSSIQIASLTFEHISLANELVAASERGVLVTLLLEGAPVGGLDDHGKYVCQQIEAAGGACWFMIRDDSVDIQDRYRFQHAKYMIIDGKRAAIGSENFSPRSHPDDDKTDGTSGHRGVVLLTDAPTIVAHLQTLFERDLDTVAHQDLFRWQANHPTYGAPPALFVPITETGGIEYALLYPTPLTVSGEMAFEIVQSPENSLRDADGLLGLVNRARTDDTVLVQQLGERPFWGTGDSNPLDDPNPRLEAYLNAARRGATVRLLLDSYFNDPAAANSNSATCHYVQAIAYQERLDADCRIGNPTGLGVHNKMVLVELSGTGFIHVGSINGSEQASKGNREVALQVQSNEAYALLADMFARDWPHRAFLPMVRHSYIGRANHVLISEVLYDPSGVDDAEFIELVNPTGQPIDISHYGLGDAVNRDDFEDVRRFPAGTILEPLETIVVATSATAFQAIYGFFPDYELLRTETAVPTLPDDPTWGDDATFIQLGNGGDEVILRDPLDNIIDVIAYGNSTYPGTQPCPLVTTSNHSLERFPYWRDSNNCQNDFRDWPFPNPKALP
ncbi:MAG: lamin tail domain-containing protein [Chloroflexota bacterium]